MINNINENTSIEEFPLTQTALNTFENIWSLFICYWNKVQTLLNFLADYVPGVNFCLNITKFLFEHANNKLVIDNTFTSLEQHFLVYVSNEFTCIVF